MTHNELIAEICSRTSRLNAAEAAEAIKALKAILRDMPTDKLLTVIAELVKPE